MHIAEERATEAERRVHIAEERVSAGMSDIREVENKASKLIRGRIFNKL